MKPPEGVTALAVRREDNDGRRPSVLGDRDVLGKPSNSDIEVIELGIFLDSLLCEMVPREVDELTNCLGAT
jgi:hypothetical protein